MEATKGKAQIRSDNPQEALENWRNTNPDKEVTDTHIQSGGVDIWWTRKAGK